MSGQRQPHELWLEAERRYLGNKRKAQLHYWHLMAQEGHIAASLDDLLTPEQHAELNADLAEMAATRRRAEGSMP